MIRTVPWSVRLLVCACLLLVGTAAGLAAQEPQRDVTRSPSMARMLAALGTAAPAPVALVVVGRDALPAMAAGAAGLVLGPTLGYLYAGETRRGLRHAATRAAVLGIATGGAMTLCTVGDCSLGVFGGEEGAMLAPAVLLIAAGVVATTVLAVRDIYRVGGVIETRNQQLGAICVQPAYFPESHKAGLLLTWRR